MDHSKNPEKILPAKNSLPDAEDCFRKENLKSASKTLLQVKAARIFAEAVEGEVSFLSITQTLPVTMLSTMLSFAD